MKHTKLKKTKSMPRSPTLAYVMIALGILANVTKLSAKTIQIENDSSETISVTIPHFTSSMAVDRYPTLSNFQLRPGEVEKLYIKPYQYNSDLYVPNYAWVKDAMDEEEEEIRQETVDTEYSFKGKNPFRRFSIKVEDTTGATYYVPLAEGNRIGELIQDMAESPEDNPDDGIFITDKKIEVKAGYDLRLYIPEEIGTGD